MSLLLKIRDSKGGAVTLCTSGVLFFVLRKYLILEVGDSVIL